ncbi:hypothetical protein [Streptomyces naphthomycinicus]|uniref:hypothetical protein n=1 Tax=Streptomyces naphthomycinicus TaxID=2872625 RepID=UPI001CECB696|nr:hypothetical protein [Streptomyces sp. TML10]
MGPQADPGELRRVRVLDQGGGVYVEQPDATVGHHREVVGSVSLMAVNGLEAQLERLRQHIADA